MYITLAELFQYTLVLIGLATLLWAMGQRKSNRPGQGRGYFLNQLQGLTVYRQALLVFIIAGWAEMSSGGRQIAPKGGAQYGYSPKAGEKVGSKCRENH